MLGLWISVSISYYITNFIIKYLKGNLFLNSSVMAVSEILSLFMAGYLYLKVGLVRALVISFFFAFSGCLLITLLESDSKYNANYMPLCVLLTRFGIGSAFGLIYLGNFIFPVQYASQTLSFCNTFARFFTVISPVISE